VNDANLKPFVKNDPRINRKGRPKSFKQLRALVVEIASEPVKEGDDRTLIEARIRKMLKSDNPSDIALALKYGWGNVPEQTDITSKGERIIVTIKSIKND
jgi:hypothetical protein